MRSQLKSIYYFCNEIIDYAGLFPPAKLDLKTSLENYIKFKNSEHSFLLSKFICPVNLLGELIQLISKSHKDEKLNLSLLIQSSDKETDFKTIVKENLEKIKDEILNCGKGISIDAIELKLPSELLNSYKEDEIISLLDYISSEIRNSFDKELFFFIEGQFSEDSKKETKKLIDSIYHHNIKFNDAGYKLRTGGITPEMFPSTELVAYSLKECIDRSVKIKFTAGLHHPFRHYDYELRTFMHGFINIFSAGLIAHRHNLSLGGMNEIISDENGNNFVYTVDCFSWKDWELCRDEIALARKELMLSFGSCSFDEPVEDLKKLKLL